MFETKVLPVDRDDIAPDGSDVRILLGLGRGGLAHFQLGSGETSVAVHHRTVEEIWFFLSGTGQMWRRDRDGHTTVDVGPGTCITIPLGTDFQFRVTGPDSLVAIGVTMPPWPGDGEAVRSAGRWVATVAPGSGLADS